MAFHSGKAWSHSPRFSFYNLTLEKKYQDLFCITLSAFNQTIKEIYNRI